MTGPAAAEVFYDDSKFTRVDAAPTRLEKTLFGKGGVQGMDGGPHEARKRLFLSCLGPTKFDSLLRIFDEEWDKRVPLWERSVECVWLDEMISLLCAVALRWSEIPGARAERLAPKFRLLIEGPGDLGFEHLKARRARRWLDRWLEHVVEEHRSQGGPHAGVLGAFSTYREEGELLPAKVVAVELNNVLRPIVAVAWFLVGLQLARKEHSEHVPAAGDAPQETHFINEVRRLHPFFPMVAARVRKAFDFQGHCFPRHRLVLLDLYGTNRDPRTWQDPAEFRPSRYEEKEDPFPVYGYLPQGGGEHTRGHRCAGEWITIELMRRYSRRVAELEFEVPAQDLRLREIPARPVSGLVLRKLRRTSTDSDSLHACGT